MSVIGVVGKHNPLKIIGAVAADALDPIMVANGTVSVAVMSARVEGGFPPYTYTWRNSSTGSPYIKTSAVASTSVESVGTDAFKSNIFVLGVTDLRGEVMSASVTVCVGHGSPP